MACITLLAMLDLILTHLCTHAAVGTLPPGEGATRP